MKLSIEIPVHIERPVADVFDYLSDLGRFPSWADEFDRVERVTDGPLGPGTMFEVVLKPPTSLVGLVRGRSDLRSDQRPAETRITWAEFERPRRLVATSTPIRRGRAEVHTTQTFTFEPTDDGTRLLAVWDRDVVGIPGERLVAPVVRMFIGREIRRAQTHALARLKTLLEAETPAAKTTAR